jgi:hypothetical protein
MPANSQDNSRGSGTFDPNAGNRGSYFAGKWVRIGLYFRWKWVRIGLYFRWKWVRIGLYFRWKWVRIGLYLRSGPVFEDCA